MSVWAKQTVRKINSYQHNFCSIWFSGCIQFAKTVRPQHHANPSFKRMENLQCHMEKLRRNNRKF